MPTTFFDIKHGWYELKPCISLKDKSLSDSLRKYKHVYVKISVSEMSLTGKRPTMSADAPNGVSLGPYHFHVPVCLDERTLHSHVCRSRPQCHTLDIVSEENYIWIAFQTDGRNSIIKKHQEKSDGFSPICFFPLPCNTR